MTVRIPWASKSRDFDLEVSAERLRVVDVAARRVAVDQAAPPFTCFASTSVQILTLTRMPGPATGGGLRADARQVQRQDAQFDARRRSS